MNIWQSKRYETLQAAIDAAKQLQRERGETMYVVHVAALGIFTTSNRMPLFGKWYDSEGICHG